MRSRPWLRAGQELTRPAGNRPSPELIWVSPRVNLLSPELPRLLMGAKKSCSAFATTLFPPSYILFFTYVVSWGKDHAPTHCHSVSAIQLFARHRRLGPGG